MERNVYKNLSEVVWSHHNNTQGGHAPSPGESRAQVQSAKQELTSTAVAEASCMRSAQLTAGTSSFTGARMATADARPAAPGGEPRTPGSGLDAFTTALRRLGNDLLQWSRAQDTGTLISNDERIQRYYTTCP